MDIEQGLNSGTALALRVNLGLSKIIENLAHRLVNECAVSLEDCVAFI